MSESQERDSALPQRLEDLDRQIVGEVRKLVADVQREIAGRLRQGSQDMLRLVEEITPRLPDTFRHRFAGLESEPQPAVAHDGEQLLEALGRLDVAGSQADLLNALLEEARRFAARVAFFLTRPGEARCWSSQGFGRAAQEIDGLTVDYSGGAWSRLASGRGVVRLDDEARRELAERLGTTAGSDAVLVPFVVRGQLGGALYADRPEGEVDLVSLQIVTYAAALALETLALRAGIASPTLRLADGSAGHGVPVWQGEAAAAPKAAPVAAAPVAEEVAEEEVAEDGVAEEDVAEEDVAEEEASAGAGDDSTFAGGPEADAEAEEEAYAAAEPEAPAGADERDPGLDTADDFMDDTAADLDAGPAPQVDASFAAPALGQHPATEVDFETAPELDEETSQAESIEPPELESAEDDDIFAAEAEADIFATAEDDEPALDEADREPADEVALSGDADDLWELEEDESPSLGGEVAEPELDEADEAPDFATAAPEATAGPEPSRPESPTTETAPISGFGLSEPREMPAVGQQTVRLDVSAIRDQGLVTPPAPRYSPPAPDDATDDAPAEEALDDYELEPESVPEADVDEDEDAGYAPPVAASEEPRDSAHTAPLPIVPATPTAPTPPTRSEDATVMVSRDQLGFGAPAPAAVPPPPAPAPPAPPATPPPAPPAAAPEPEERGGSSEVRPPDDVQGPGLAFRRQEAAIDASVPEGDAALHEEARRLARLLVSEIKLYNEELIEVGRRDGNIYERLREDIDRSRQMYEERIDPRVSESDQDYFRQEMVQRLAGGDPSVLGL